MEIHHTIGKGALVTGREGGKMYYVPSAKKGQISEDYLKKIEAQGHKIRVGDQEILVDAEEHVWTQVSGHEVKTVDLFLSTLYGAEQAVISDSRINELLVSLFELSNYDDPLILPVIIEAIKNALEAGADEELLVRFLETSAKAAQGGIFDPKTKTLLALLIERNGGEAALKLPRIQKLIQAFSGADLTDLQGQINAAAWELVLSTSKNSLTSAQLSFSKNELDASRVGYEVGHEVFIAPHKDWLVDFLRGNTFMVGGRLKTYPLEPLDNPEVGKMAFSQLLSDLSLLFQKNPQESVRNLSQFLHQGNFFGPMVKIGEKEMTIHQESIYLTSIKEKGEMIQITFFLPLKLTSVYDGGQEKTKGFPLWATTVLTLSKEELASGNISHVTEEIRFFPRLAQYSEVSSLDERQKRTRQIYSDFQAETKMDI